MKSTPMRGAMRGLMDRLLGRGSAAVTVPPLDGALKPNNLIEEAPASVRAQQPDNLVEWQGQLLFSSGARVLRLATLADGSDASTTVVDVAGSVTAMAVSSSGLLAIATDSSGISSFDGTGAVRQITRAGVPEFNRTTAMTFADSQTLLVCVGSSENTVHEWPRDLLTGGQSGSLWRVDVLSGVATRLTTGLAYPNGIALAPDGTCIVSESWHKRLLKIDMSGQVVAQVLEDLPGYPGRLTRSARGGYWLSVFAPRSQLIEFVLREPAYLRTMMEEVEPELWIAPSLSSGKSVLEPMQGGALKQMGVLKPWAPTQSYGLVMELSEAFVPVRSMHSRAGGRRHGVTSAVQAGDALWISSKGGDELVRLDVAQRTD